VDHEDQRDRLTPCCRYVVRAVRLKEGADDGLVFKFGLMSLWRGEEQSRMGIEKRNFWKTRCVVGNPGEELLEEKMDLYSRGSRYLR
jgi:hypothetical protein